MAFTTFFLLTIIITTHSACPSIDIVNSLSKTCTFYFSDSSPSCPFNKCTNPSILSGTDWSNCIQNCCNKMTPPTNQNPSGVQECLDYVSYTNKTSGLGTKDIIIILAINVGVMILLLILIKLCGNCCCEYFKYDIGKGIDALSIRFAHAA